MILACVVEFYEDRGVVLYPAKIVGFHNTLISVEDLINTLRVKKEKESYCGKSKIILDRARRVLRKFTLQNKD